MMERKPGRAVSDGYDQIFYLEVPGLGGVAGFEVTARGLGGIRVYGRGCKGL